MTGDPEARLAATRVRVHLFGESGSSPKIGRFTLQRKVGTGAMGVVFSARDETLDRSVAVKVLHGTTRSASASARMVREAQAMARLSHPNVVQIYEAGEIEGRVFIAMEFVAGGTLKQWCAALRAGPSRWRAVVACFLDVGRGLCAAHRAGVIHRDLKPDNVLITEDGTPKVADFGLAGVGTSAVERTDPAVRDLSPTLTQTGARIGTPRYMAPEQHAGLPADERSDQFGFCVALFEALYERPPFPGATPEAVAAAASNGEVEPPTKDAAVPKRIHAVILRGLAVSPTDRWPSMNALLRALQPRRSSARWVAAGGGLLGLAAAASWAAGTRNACAGADALVREVWNEAGAQAVSAAMTGTGAPFAPKARDRVIADLDAWAAAWARQYQEACEATQRGEQSPATMDGRVACLMKARVKAQAAVEVLTHATRKTVERADAIADGVPAPGDCSVVDPDAQFTHPQAEATEGLLAASAARRAGGDAKGALEKVNAIELDDGPAALQAAVALERGRVLDGLGRFEESSAALARAQDLAAQARRWDLVREATIKRVIVIGVRQSRPAEVLETLPFIEGLVRGDVRGEAHLSNTRGMLLHHAGDAAGSAAALQRSVELLIEVDGSEHRNVAHAKADVAAALQSAGRYADAERIAREARDSLIELLGPTHPDVARARNNRANALASQGETEEAEAELRTAAAECDRAYQRTHAACVRYRLNLAFVLPEGGKLSESEALFREVIAAREASFGAESPLTANARGGLGLVLSRQERYAEAIDELEASLAIQRAAYGDKGARLAKTEANLAIAFQEVGRIDEAAALMAGAVTSSASKLEADHPDVVSMRILLAHMWIDGGRFADASGVLDAVAGVVERAPISALHGSKYYYARARLARGTKAAAPLVDKALDALDADTQPHTEYRARVQSLLETKQERR